MSPISLRTWKLLRKAASFDPGLYPKTPGGYVPTAFPGMRYEGFPQVFCLNDEGLVTAAR